MSTSSRFRYTLVAGATAVVIGVGFTVAGLNRHADVTADGPLVSVEPPPYATDPTTGELLDDAASVTTSASVPPSPQSSSPSAAATIRPPATPVQTPARPATQKPAPPKTVVAPRPPTVDPPATSAVVLNAVLADINAARTAAGLSAYTLDPALSKASALHNQLMIGGCGLLHQCPGEAAIGARFTAQGVPWTAAGENIGFGTSGSSEAAAIVAANGLTAGMLAETAPNDGHRKNLLSATFKRIGLSVVASGGKVWMTQDFVN
jgi:uncharacterized protein YkwD